MKNLFAAAALAVVGLSASTAKADWTNTVLITQIEVNDVYGRGTPSFYLSFSAAPGSTNCSNSPSGVWQINAASLESNKNIMSQATSAKEHGRPVKVYFSGCGTNGYPSLTGIQVF